MVFLYILAGILVIVIQAYLATVFSNIAQEKGYDDSKYFLLPLFFGIIGYLAVVALPDRGNEQEKVVVTIPATPNAIPQPTQSDSNIVIKEAVKPETDTTSETKEKIEQASVQIVDGKITCPNCGTVQRPDRIVCYNCACKFIKE